MKLYPATEKSTFSYWFAHWRAFQKTAFKLRVWKPWYLFHDIEKPFLMWEWKDYPRVRAWHRKHNKHHYQYDNGEIAPWMFCDYVAMVVDWECSHLSKLDEPYNAYEEFCNKVNAAFDEKNPVVIHILVNYMLPVLYDLNLANQDEFEKTDLAKKINKARWTKWDGSKFYKEMYGREVPEEVVYQNCTVFDEDGEIKWETKL
jgi:hypothetical protein